VDVRLSATRDLTAAEAFFRSAWTVTGVTPDRITTDGHDAYLHAIRNVVGHQVAHRTNRFLNNHVEQDHRAIKRVTRPMLGFKSLDAAHDTLAGIELMHMLKKRQLVVEEGVEDLTAAEWFYSLAA
jgi:putative transposase